MGGALDLAAELGGIPTQKREGFVHERDYENWQFPLNAQHIAAPAPDPIDSLPERARSKLRALEFQYREASGASSAISDDIRYHRDLAREHRDKSSEAAYQAKEDRA